MHEPGSLGKRLIPVSELRKYLLLIGVFSALVVAACMSIGSESKPAETYPKCVLLIRHSEKPPENVKSVHLSDDGIKRAESLPNVFVVSKGRPDPLPSPDFIFAAKDSKESHRPAETVLPLAAKLKLSIDSRFRNEDYELLARELFRNPKYAGKTIVISWHHGNLPELAAALKAGKAPKNWKAAVFDRVWAITYDEGKATFRDLPQQLMPGDSDR
jgi:hypothetical protein